MSRERRGGPARRDPSVARFLSQVSDALHLALASADDPRLADAALVDVIVSPGSGPLRVVVAAPIASVDDVLAALDASRGRLRSEVAASIHRKRTPELSFVVVPRDDVDVD